MADQYLVEAAQKYGVPLGLLEGIAAAEGASWDLVHPGGEIGRFGLHPVHEPEILQKYGLTLDQLRYRPDIQIAYWVPRIAQVWNKAMAAGKGVVQAAWDVVNTVQAPAAEYREREVNSILQNLGQEGGGTMTQQTTIGGIPAELDTLLEGDWARDVAVAKEQILSGQATAPGLRLPAVPGGAELDKAAIDLVLDQAGVGSKDAWKTQRATQYGYQATWETGTAQEMTPYESASIALQYRQQAVSEMLEDVAHEMEVSGWSWDKAAQEFTNRLNALEAGGSLAQAAETIRTSQLARRAPPPNVPGGYQPYTPEAFTKYGLTAPKPMAVQPEIFPDPWAEMQKGMAMAGPTTLPPREPPAFPNLGAVAGQGAQAQVSSIAQAYNNIMARTGSPTPDYLTRQMAPTTVSGPQMTLAPQTVAGPQMTVAPQTVSGPLMSSPPTVTPAPTWGPAGYEELLRKYLKLGLPREEAERRALAEFGGG